MKKSGILTLSLLTVVLMLFISGCKTSKSVVNPGKEVADLPCFGKGFQSDANFFRFSATSKSQDLMTAKKKALAEARAGLASMLNSTLKGVTDNYAKSVEYQKREELEKRFESLTREVVDKELNGSRIICEKFIKDDEGFFNAYVCLEQSTSDMLSSMNNRISRDDLLKIDYDYEKFKKTFEEEMKKLGR